MTRRRRAARAFHAKVTHPLTGKQLRISARTCGQLEALRAHVESLREGLRFGTMTEHEVQAKLSRLGGRRAATLEQAARSYCARPLLAAHTRRRTESLLTRHLGELGPLTLHELDAPRVSRWVEELGRRLTGSSVRVAWATLKGIVRHAQERGMIDRCPWGSWRPTIRGRVSERLPREAARSAGELRLLMAATARIDDRSLGPKIAAAALLGLRQGELAGLRWSDVDASGGAVTIARGAAGPTKGRRVDVLLAVPYLFNVLGHWAIELEALGLFKPDGPVFPCGWRSTPGDPKPYLGRAEVLTCAELRMVVTLAGLPNPERWSPHSLRDTFVTLEAQGSGGDLAALRERSRHASITGLVRYLRARTREPAAPRMLLDDDVVPPALPPSSGTTKH